MACTSQVVKCNWQTVSYGQRATFSSHLLRNHEIREKHEKKKGGLAEGDFLFFVYFVVPPYTTGYYAISRK
jgi:hypothetical protein